MGHDPDLRVGQSWRRPGGISLARVGPLGPRRPERRPVRHRDSRSSEGPGAPTGDAPQPAVSRQSRSTEWGRAPRPRATEWDNRGAFRATASSLVDRERRLTWTNSGESAAWGRSAPERSASEEARGPDLPSGVRARAWAIQPELLSGPRWRSSGGLPPHHRRSWIDVDVVAPGAARGRLATERAAPEEARVGFASGMAPRSLPVGLPRVAARLPGLALHFLGSVRRGPVALPLRAALSPRSFGTCHLFGSHLARGSCASGRPASARTARCAYLSSALSSSSAGLTPGRAGGLPFWRSRSAGQISILPCAPGEPPHSSNSLRVGVGPPARPKEPSGYPECWANFQCLPYSPREPPESPAPVSLGEF